MPLVYLRRDLDARVFLVLWAEAIASDEELRPVFAERDAAFRQGWADAIRAGVLVGVLAWRSATPVGVVGRGPAMVALGVFAGHFLSHRAARVQVAALLAVVVAGTAVLLTGPEDIVTDGERLCRVSGGSPWMTRITGTGCMLSALCGAFAAAEPDAFTAAALAAAFWKVCAAQAERSLGSGQGAGALRSALMDAASLLDGGTLAALAQTELF